MAYHVDSSLDQSKGVMFVHAGIDGADFRRTLSMVEGQVADIASGNMGDDEIEQTRKALIDRIRGMEDHPSEQIYSLLEMVIHGSVLTIDELVGKIGSVDREAIVRAARKVRLDTVYCLAQKKKDNGKGC
ncbi:MAG: hypothetical protein A2Z34_01500 [Planctomycetes bacterium RBG_16_59_8]|nr:MAG: hypothetical protein A2Z34_01500 [Planctomycetes bacterium RBG_16_59_8]